MEKQSEWLDVQAAADFVGKSVSTLRRWIAQTEGKPFAAGNIRREPFKDKGGEKILLSRAFLVEQFSLPGSAQDTPAGGEQAAGLVEILERQLLAKDGQIQALQRDSEAKNRLLEQEQQTAADLAERVREMSALNAALQTKILLLSEKAGEVGRVAPPTSSAQDRRRETVFSSPAYFVAVAVVLSLCIGLVLFLILS